MIAAGVWTMIDFNPRTHIECDSKEGVFIPFMEDFNPRTHIECDLPLSPW